MKVSRILRVMLALGFLLVWAGPALAFWPPLQQVTGPTVTQFYNYTAVSFSVYNPATGADIPGSWGIAGGPGKIAVDPVYAIQGVICWRVIDKTFPLNLKYKAVYGVFDPGRGWRLEETGWYDHGGWFLINDGIVLWEQDSGSESRLQIMTYDPLLNAGWRTHLITVQLPTGQPPTGHQISGNTVAFILKDAGEVHYCIYHYWGWGFKEGVSSGIDNPTNLAIAADTVTWKDSSGVTYKRGYHSPTGNWFVGDTIPFPEFAPQPTSGKAPLTVWFTDLSLGGNNWTYNFGDGSPPYTGRSTYHNYTALSYLENIVRYDVSGPGGSFSSYRTITTDGTPPNGSLNINGGAAYTNFSNVTLSLNAADDSGTVSEMRLRNAGEAWRAWEDYQTSRAWALSWVEGLRTVEAQFRDGFGNESSVVSASIIMDTTPPQGSITLNDGAQYTRTTGVSVKPTATDASSGVAKVQLSNDNTNFQEFDYFPHTYYIYWPLTPGDGPKTVYAQFRDNAGNTSASVTASITVDTVAPKDGTLTAAPGNQKVTLTWAGFSDVGSGIQTYRLYYSASAYPTAATGTKIYEGTALTFVHQGLANGKPACYRLYAVDKAGNVSAGATAMATPKAGALPWLELLLD